MGKERTFNHLDWGLQIAGWWKINSLAALVVDPFRLIISRSVIPGSICIHGSMGINNVGRRLGGTLVINLPLLICILLICFLVRPRPLFFLVRPHIFGTRWVVDFVDCRRVALWPKFVICCAFNMHIEWGNDRRGPL